MVFIHCICHKHCLSSVDAHKVPTSSLSLSLSPLSSLFLSLSLSLSLSLFLSLSRSLSSKNVVAGSNIMHDNVGLGWLQCDEPKSSFPRFHSEFPE